jgi:hypothetical protein
MRLPAHPVDHGKCARRNTDADGGSSRSRTSFISVRLTSASANVKPYTTTK